MRGDEHRFAQVGNEVGWRNPDAFYEYLRKSNFKCFIYSYKADAFDSYYTLLKDLGVAKGVFKLQGKSKGGEVYTLVK